MATYGLRQLIFIDHPNIIFPAISTALAIPALASTPSFIPTILLLSCLLLYTKIIARRPRVAVHLATTWLFVSAGQTVGEFVVSRNAVASPVGALLSAFVLSCVSTGIHLLLIFADVWSGKFALPWARLTFFPSLFSTGVQVIANLSPLGYLMTWSPTSGIDSYEWMRPTFGPWGVNWVVAALAIVGAELAGWWFINENQEEDVSEPGLDEHAGLLIEHPILSPEAAKKRAIVHGSKHVAFLAGSIFILAIPSFFTRPLPVSPFSDASTPIDVGCVLPRPSAEGALTFDDYIAETVQVVGRSRRQILLWPESAVRFESTADREEKLERLFKIQAGGYVAVSYEEPEPNAGQRSGLRRNGVLVQGPDGIVLDYHKRNLVPFVESFPLASGSEDPEVITINMPALPNGGGRPGARLRDITLTASICLDFVSPRALSGLSEHPALVLAPARTWHPDVSRAMWEQTRARAAEIGSAALFCDGGQGGFSGVASAGLHEPTQLGPGTWIRTIGVSWPLDDRKTAYAAVGDWAMFFVVWLIMGVGAFGESAAVFAARRFAPFGGSLAGVARRASALLTRKRATDAEGHQVSQGEQEPLLH
ncbi:hypothetical protein PENSPDRAFT_600961 [Peniophora sp. CONT]|nr:hypothetical protein PENSPDRAFT_600961 [Peniophora sp. CONT]